MSLWKPQSLWNSFGLKKKKDGPQKKRQKEGFINKMATYKIKCPICDSTIEATYYAESIGVVEEIINCDRCGFIYEFACGNYTEND